MRRTLATAALAFFCLSSLSFLSFANGLQYVSPNTVATEDDLKQNPSCLADLPSLLAYNQHLPIRSVQRQIEAPPNITRAFVYTRNMGIGAIFGYRLLTSAGWRIKNGDTRPLIYEAYSDTFVNYSAPFSNVTYEGTPAYGQEFLWRLVDQPISLDSKTLRGWNYPPIVNLSMTDYNAYESIKDFDHLHKTFHQHFSWKAKYQRRANDFVAKHGINNCTTLAVHYRGTDKINDEVWPEAYAADWDYIFGTILHFLTVNPHYDSVFLASDEQRFIDQIQQTLSPILGKRIRWITIDDPTRANGPWVAGSGGVHHSKVTPVDMKLEYTVMNLLVMSECGFLLKSPSAMSALAKVMNPRLPVLLFNPPFYDWFPDGGFQLHPFYRPEFSTIPAWLLFVDSPSFWILVIALVACLVWITRKYRTLDTIKRKYHSVRPTAALEAIRRKLPRFSTPKSTFDELRRND